MIWRAHETYESKIDCWRGAQATKKYAQTAPIIDQTR